MIFGKNEHVRPKEFDRPIPGVPLTPQLHRVEYWSCYNCGKVRALLQWKRTFYLQNHKVERGGLTGDYTNKQLQSVPGEELLPDGWALQDTVYEKDGEEYTMRILVCETCKEKHND